MENCQNHQNFWSDRSVKNWIGIYYFCYFCIFCSKCNKNLWIRESLVKHRTISPNLVTSHVVRGMIVAWSFCSLSRLCYQLPGGKTFMKPTLELLLHVNFSFFEPACTAASGIRNNRGVAKRNSKISSTHFDTTKWNESWTMMMRWENNNL